MVLREHRKYIRRVKAVEVVDKHGSLAKPLTVKLAPHGLCPAGIGYCEMQSVRVDIMPIFRGVEMTQTRIYNYARRSSDNPMCRR